MMTRNYFELYTTFRLERHVKFGGFSNIPKAQVVERSTNWNNLASHSNTLQKTNHAKCRQSGKAATHETTPELEGFLRVLSNLGVPSGPDIPSCLASQTSIVPFRRPAYI